MTDSRHNLPSASQIPRLALCPGSWHLSQLVPATSTVYSESGDRVHAAWSGEREDLTESERETLEGMIKQERAFVKQYFGDAMICHVGREQRLWYVRGNGQKVFSGRLDVFYRFNDLTWSSAVIDGKSLWGDTPPPAVNLQLRAQAVLMWHVYHSRRVMVGICQPNKSGFISPAEYNEEYLRASEKEILHIIERAMAPDAPVIPSPDACKHCPAKLICRVAHHDGVGKLEATALANSLISSNIADCTDERLDRLGQAWEIAQIIGKEIDAEIRRRYESDPSRMPNYTLEPSGHQSEIARPGNVFPKFSHLLTAEEFSNSCKVIKGDLENAVKKKTGLPTKEAKKTVETLLEGSITRTPKKPSLQRKPYHELTK